MTFSHPAAVMDRLAPTGLCECGCGKRTKIATRTNSVWGHVKGQPLRFIVGHSGRSHGNAVWYLDRRSGRWVVVGRDHKNYLWYRVLMENELGRPLRQDEHVHHINGDQADDRVENLKIISPSEHARLHAIESESWRNLGQGQGHKYTSEEAKRAGKLGAAVRNAQHVPRFCDVADCDRTHYGHGMCHTHYMREWRNRRDAR